MPKKHFLLSHAGNSNSSTNTHIHTQSYIRYVRFISSLSSHMTLDCCWRSFLPVRDSNFMNCRSSLEGVPGGWETPNTWVTRGQFRVGGRHPIPGSPGANFTNILQAAFICADPKSVKETDSLTVFFALLWSACLKALIKMLMKLTPGVNFTHNFEHFFYEIVLHSFYVLTGWFSNFVDARGQS